MIYSLNYEVISENLRWDHAVWIFQAVLCV